MAGMSGYAVVPAIAVAVVAVAMPRLMVVVMAATMAAARSGIGIVPLRRGHQKRHGRRRRDCEFAADSQEIPACRSLALILVHDFGHRSILLGLRRHT